jgi:hypothetical protein
VDASYQRALDRYYANPLYRNLHFLVAPVVLGLQFWVLYCIPWAEVNPAYLVIALWAYFLADFVNGFVHLHMDHATGYDSAIGPLIAVFHQHHVKPRYTDKHWLLVYAVESGFKNWLAFYLAALAVAQALGLPPEWSFLFALAGVFSSCAEVSHFLAHNSEHRFVRALQRVGILLDPEHHDLHHKLDNQAYAFLNGATDPLLDRIAARFYPGYKTTTDTHSGACVSAEP